MSCFKTKYTIIVILFVWPGALLMKEEVDISIYSSADLVGDGDYIVVKIGDPLSIWCISKEKMRGMRIEHVDFDSYDPKHKKINITWQDDFGWYDHALIGQYNDNQTYEYKLLLNIESVGLQHSGWQICYINEYTNRYLYVFIENRFRKADETYKFIKTKLNSKITIPCIAPIPNFHFNFLYTTNYSFSISKESLKPFPDNLIFNYNDRIGFQVMVVSTFTKFFCCYTGLSHCVFMTAIIEVDEDENNLMPMFNEEYSAITSLGTDVKMECILINAKNLSISIHWGTPNLFQEKFNDQIIDFTVEVMANTTIHISTLTVKNITMNDLGFYKCSIIDFNKKEIGFAHRQIFKKVNPAYNTNSITYFRDKNIPIIENENCILVCEASFPITWNYDLIDKKILIPNNVFISSSFNNDSLEYESMLNITSATTKNNGFYYCHEKNTRNEIEKKLYQKDRFIYVISDETSVNLTPNEVLTKIYVPKYSTNAKITCVAKTTYSLCYLYSQNEYIRSLKKNTFHYEFLLQTGIDKAVTFECVCGIPGLSYLYTKNIFDIKPYESFHENSLPYLNLKYNKNVTVGEELKVNCTILRYCKQCKSNERPSVNWRYNVNSTNITERISTIETYIPLHNAELYLSTLVIKNAQKTDSYEYECSVEKLSLKINVNIDEKIINNSKAILLIILTFVLIVIIAIFILFIKQMRLQSKIRKVGLSNFNKGVKGILNPKLYINLQAEMLPYDTKLEISRSKIRLGQQLGSGNFGLIFKGEIFGHFAGETVKTVAIKMMKRNMKYEHIKTLIVELKVLNILGRHLNVIDLLGACTENLDKMELLVILEYCHYGNIRDVLQNNRNNFLNLINSKSSDIVTSTSYETTNRNAKVENIEENSNYNQQITTNTLINWAYQISCGMEFMASRKVLHGDLAARNILLNSNHIIKICDFGLSKNLSLNYNYKKKTQCPLPIKWMAIETIREKIFSTQSDVWSFGVVLWEIFSLAQTPYPNLQENIDFFHKLNNGYRMEQPEYSTKEIYEMMLKCWEHNPKHRPSFTLINNFLESILEQAFHNHYLELCNEFGAELRSSQQQKYLETSF